LKNRFTAIFRILIANEFYVITPFGVNGMCIQNSGSKIEKIVTDTEERFKKLTPPRE
jgi:hypothetical protein